MCAGLHSVSLSPALIFADITPPVITLLGPTLIRLEANVDVYVELGCQAWDSFEGNLTAKVTLTDNTTSLMKPRDVFVVMYSVSDSSGNTANAQRTVLIVDKDSGASVTIAAIAAGIIAAVVVILVIIIVFVVLRRRNKNKTAADATRKSNAHLLAAGLCFACHHRS